MKKLFLLLACCGLIISCSNPPGDHSASKKEADNKARMQRFYNEVINAHNVSMIDSFCMPDFTDHNPSPGHSGKGIDDLKASFTEMMAAFPDMKASTDFMVADGDTVVAMVTMSGTHTGALGPMPATNKSFSIKGIDIVVLNNEGKATQRWGVFEDMAMMKQLGMIPEPGAAPDSAQMAAEKK
jgi:predicted ester cyclase